MNAEMITVGLDQFGWDSAGTAVNFLSHELSAFGMQVENVLSSHPDVNQLAELIRVKTGQSAALIITGVPFDKIAPAVCDAICNVHNTAPVLDGESWNRVKEYHRNTKIDSVGAESLAIVPSDSNVFPNEHGTAPGYCFTAGQRRILVLPGEPGQLFAMFSDFVAPFLTNITGGTVFSRTVGAFGLSESALIERLSDIMSEPNPETRVYSHEGETVVRVVARADSRHEATRMCDASVEEIKSRLGINSYGVDLGSLQKAVVILLLDKKKKIATAESCTAGLLSARLTEIAGISSVFECGVSAYSAEIKQNVLGVSPQLMESFGTVSPQTATAMAVGVRNLGRASLGVSITGVAGPEPSEGKAVGTVYIALADEKRVWVKRMSVSDPAADREYIRNLATAYALDLVRRYLEALPAVMAGGEPIPYTEPAAAPEIPQTAATAQKRPLIGRFIPWKGDSKSAVAFKSAMITGFILLVSVLVFGFYSYVLVPQNNRSLYDSLSSLRTDTLPFEPDSGISYPAGMLSRFGSLYTRNQDVRGWVSIENTGINYPFMKHDEAYRFLNFDRAASYYGVPYLISGEVDSTGDVFRSLVISGNNRDGQMFSDLTEYDSIDFLRDHPIIVTDTLYHSDIKWEIFSVMLVAEYRDGLSRFDYTKSTFWRDSSDAPDTDFLEFTGRLTQRSLYTFPAGHGAEEGDSLLLLTTPYYRGGRLSTFEDARIVVAARQLRANESANPDMSGVRKNPAAVMPPEYYLAVYGETAPLSQTTTPPITTEATAVQTEDHTEDTGDLSDTQEQVSTSTASPSGETTTSYSLQTTKTVTESKQDITTVTTTAATTSTTEPPIPEPPDVLSIVGGTVNESEYLRSFKFIEKGGSGTVNSIDTAAPMSQQKEQLQMYLARIVSAECGSASMTENDFAAQQAQTIAAYTYILYSNMREGKTPECPVKNINLSQAFDKNLYDAVGQVLGIKLLAGDYKTPLYTAYFASAPGRTLDNIYMFGSSQNHLRSVESKYDHTVDTSWTTTYTVTMSEFTRLLGVKTGQTILLDSGPAPFFVREYDPYGLYVMSTNAYYLQSGNKVYINGRTIREACTPLRSISFQVTSCTDASLTLTVKGYGHGVGMSQYGAAGYAKNEKWGFRQILSHYYSINSNNTHRLVAPIWS